MSQRFDLAIVGAGILGLVTSGAGASTAFAIGEERITALLDTGTSP